jgi:alcohol dehydrogenase (cytochrome c)
VSLQQVWSYATDTRITSSPVIVNGIVYFGTWRGQVVALDSSSGDLLWRRSLGANDDWVYGGPRGVIGSIAVDGGVAYAVSGNCSAAALDARTGRQRWRTTICNVRENDDTYASPVVTQGLVLLGVGMLADRPTDRGREVALDARTGKIRWTMYPQQYVGTGTGISATPAINERAGVGYLGTGNPTPASNPPPGPDLGSDSIIAFDVGTGEALWTFGPVNPHDTHDQDFFASPNRFRVWSGGHARWLIGDANKNGTYYALDAQTGRLVWQHAVLAEPIGTAAVANGAIYVTAYADADGQGTVAALRTRDGLEMWRYDGAGMYESPAVWGSVVFVTEATGWLDALSAGTGDVLGRWHIGGYLHGRGPSVIQDKLFLATGTRLICYAFSAQ